MSLGKSARMQICHWTTQADQGCLGGNLPAVVESYEQGIDALNPDVVLHVGGEDHGQLIQPVTPTAAFNQYL